MPGVRVVFNRILAHAEPRQSSLTERGAVRAAEISAARRDRADDAIFFERFKNLSHDLRRLRRAKDSRTAHAPRSRVDIEITTKLLVTGLWVFKRSKMLLDVSLRTQQTLFFSAPKRDANRATGLNSESLQNARRFHHDGAADGVVSCAGRCVP